MRLVAKPGSNRTFRARRDIFVRCAVAVQPAHERWHIGRLGIARRIAEQPTKMRRQDRWETTGQCFQNVSPERLHPGRVMVIGKEIQLCKEIPRFHGSERDHLP